MFCLYRKRLIAVICVSSWAGGKGLGSVKSLQWLDGVDKGSGEWRDVWREGRKWLGWYFVFSVRVLLGLFGMGVRMSFGLLGLVVVRYMFCVAGMLV